MRSTHSYRGWTQPLPDTPSTTAWNCKGSSHQAPRSTHSYHVERNPRPTNHSKGLKFQGGRGQFNLVQPHRNNVEWQPGPVENRETVGELWIFNHLQPRRPGGYHTLSSCWCRHHLRSTTVSSCLRQHQHPPTTLGSRWRRRRRRHQPTTLSSCRCRHQHTPTTLGLYWCRHHNPPTTLGT